MLDNSNSGVDSSEAKMPQKEFQTMKGSVVASKVNIAAKRCGDTWNQVRSTAVRFREDQRGGIEKVVAIAIVVVITSTALIAISVKVQQWVNDVPDPSSGGDYTID